MDQGARGAASATGPSAADVRVLLEAMAELLTFLDVVDSEVVDDDRVVGLLEAATAALDDLPAPMRTRVIAGLDRIAVAAGTSGRRAVANAVDSLIESLGGDDEDPPAPPGALDSAAEAVLHEVLLDTIVATGPPDLGLEVALLFRNLSAAGRSRLAGTATGMVDRKAQVGPAVVRRARLEAISQALLDPTKLPARSPMWSSYASSRADERPAGQAVDDPLPDPRSVPALSDPAPPFWGPPSAGLGARRVLWVSGRARRTGPVSPDFPPDDEPTSVTLGLVEGADLVAAFTVTGTDWRHLAGLAMATLDSRTDGVSAWFRLSSHGRALMLRSVRLGGHALFEIRGEAASGIHLKAAGGEQVWELRAAPAAALDDEAKVVAATAVALDSGGRIVVSGDRAEKTRPMRPDRAASLGASLGLMLDGDPLGGAAGPIGNMDVLEAWLIPDGTVGVHVTLGERRYEVAVSREAVGALVEALRTRARDG